MNWLTARPKNLILPLDFAAAIGGSLKATWENLAENEECTWYLSPSLLKDMRNKSIQSEIRATEALILIDEWPIDKFCAREVDIFLATRFLSTLAELERKVTAVDEADLPDIPAWGAGLFPSINSASLVEKYALQFPEVRAFPWEGFRFFPGFLRNVEPSLATSAAIDWARFQASYSPQTEMEEGESLANGEVIVNPTLQILRPQGQGESIHLIWRWESQIFERQIGWREAMLIDEISETPRSQLAAVIEHVRSESLGVEGLLGQDHQTFEEALLRLSLAHVLLTKQD